MGVIGLQIHLTRLGYQGKRVDLVKELKVNGENGKPLGLVFDVSGLYYRLLHYPFGMPPVSIQHGGQYLHFYFNVRAFCEIFVLNGIPLHFIFDGLTTLNQNKRLKKVRSIERDANRRIAAAEILLEDGVSPQETWTYDSLLPHLCEDVFLEVLEDLQKKHPGLISFERALVEADRTVARRAMGLHGDTPIQTKFYGLVGEDSDFIAFGGLTGARYIPFFSFKFEDGSLFASVFDSGDIATLLGLKNSKALIQFACLCGNDFLLWDFHLKAFHSSIGIRNRTEIPSRVSEFLSTFRGAITAKLLFPDLDKHSQDMMFENYTKAFQFYDVSLQGEDELEFQLRLNNKVDELCKANRIPSEWNSNLISEYFARMSRGFADYVSLLVIGRFHRTLNQGIHFSQGFSQFKKSADNLLGDYFWNPTELLERIPRIKFIEYAECCRLCQVHIFTTLI
jgi:hypothetical protein